jgi:hypothetical protein
MNDNMKRKGIVFNLNSVEERELYEFCESRSGNFSGFVKRVLFLYMSGKITPNPNVTTPPTTEEVPVDDDDKDFMKDLF